MKTMLILAFALLALSAVAQDKPAKAAEVQKLAEQLSVEKWFVGDWICEGVQHASPAGPGVKFTDRFSFEMALHGLAFARHKDEWRIVMCEDEQATEAIQDDHASQRRRSSRNSDTGSVPVTSR
jgi:hypothetical protein